MGHQKSERNTDELIDTICVGCDLPFPVNDLGLCENCFARLERDLIRSRDWEYSVTAFAVAPDQLEALRERVIRDYGADYELIEPPGGKKRKPKPKRSKSQRGPSGTTTRMMCYRQRGALSRRKTRNG